MSVQTYSLARDGNAQIAPNFRIREFASGCGSDKILIDTRLPRVLQRIRAILGNKAVTVNSGYRSPEHNAKAGGAPQSLHMGGMAADISIAGVPPVDMCRAAETALAESKIPGGICLYTGRSFVHVDVRGVRWRGQDDGNGARNVNGWSPMPAPALPATPTPTPVPLPPHAAVPNDKRIWDFLVGKGLGHFAADGIMGNLMAESGLLPNNLQNTFNARLGLSDAEYTARVDDGRVTRADFISILHGGYGLSQWTFHSRKAGLYDLAKARKASIADLQVQLDFLWTELTRDFPGVLSRLKAASSVSEASDIVLTRFMMPADQGIRVRELRARYGQDIFNKFAGKPAAPATPAAPPQFASYRVRVNGDGLNTRLGPTVNSGSDGVLNTGDALSVLEEKRGPVDSQGTVGKWGRVKVLRNGKQADRWIALVFTKRV